MDNKHSISGLNKRSSHLASIRQSFKLLPLAKLNFNIQNNIQKQTLKTGPTSQNLTKESILTQADEEPSEVERRYGNVSQYFQNKYQTLQKLGSGSNAFVYKCQEKQSQRLFAVKKVNVQPQQIEEIRKNYSMIAELNHPQICKYQSFYYDRSQNVTYTVMEYCPFPSLGSCKLKNEEELISLVKQIISSLEYLHQNSICHRDIKPQNILYDQKNKIIKIIDFQISKKLLVNGLKRDLLTIVGSSYYFAPQIYLGGGYDERIDLWSLGITIFKMITGYTPFESQYCLQTIQNILKGEVIFCDQIFRTYNLQARNFVLRLLKPKHQRMSISECKKHPWLAMKSSCNNQ